MTRLRADIDALPARLLRVLDGLDAAALDRAAALVRNAAEVWVVGIGASWNAGIAVARRFGSARLVDASEVPSMRIPEGAAVVALSRSGRSVEIVRLLDRLGGRAPVVGITNDPAGPLATRSDVALLLGAPFDHAVSVSMCAAPALVGGLVAERTRGPLPDGLLAGLAEGLREAGRRIPEWAARIEESGWLRAEGATYFLGRGAGLAAAHEARLLWEEAAKAPATALTTGGFRHGPQELAGPGLRAGIWLAPGDREAEDVRLARDLEGQGTRVMLVGPAPPRDAAGLVLETPPAPPGWAFPTEVLPAFLAAEAFARRRGADCDAFRLCPAVVTAEGGL